MHVSKHSVTVAHYETRQGGETSGAKLLLVTPAAHTEHHARGASAAADGTDAADANVLTPLLNTDWRDSLIADFPLREPPEASNLSSCVAICRGVAECVAVAWNPANGQAQCQLKCAARAADRFVASNTTGVIVRPNQTSCPLPTSWPAEWDADIAAGEIRASPFWVSSLNSQSERLPRQAQDGHAKKTQNRAVFPFGRYSPARWPEGACWSCGERLRRRVHPEPTWCEKRIFCAMKFF